VSLTRDNNKEAYHLLSVIRVKLV